MATTSFRKLRLQLYGTEDSRLFPDDNFASETDVLLNPNAAHFPRKFSFEGMQITLEPMKDSPMLNIILDFGSNVVFSLGKLSATTLYPDPIYHYRGNLKNIALPIFPFSMRFGGERDGNKVTFERTLDNKIVSFSGVQNAFGVSMYSVDCSLNDVMEYGLVVFYMGTVEPKEIRFTKENMLGNRAFIVPFRDSFQWALFFQDDQSPGILMSSIRTWSAAYIPTFVGNNLRLRTGVVQVNGASRVTVVPDDYWSIMQGVYSMLLTAIRSPFIMDDDFFYGSTLPDTPMEIFEIPDPLEIGNDVSGTISQTTLEPIKFANQLSLTSKTIKALPKEARESPAYKDWLARYRKAPWLGQQCSVCRVKKSQLYLCGACMQTVYCSPQCQRNDHSHPCIQTK